MGIVVAFFISLDYDDFSGTGKNAVALLRKLCANRLIGVSVLLHPLGKLANVVKVVANLNVVVVDISASSHLVFVPGKVDLDFAAIGDAEQFLIVAVNEPDTLCRVLHVPIEPVLDIAVAVKVVFALVRVQTQQIGVLVRIDTDTVVVLLGGHFALRIRVAVISQVLPVVKNISFLTQRIDNLVKLLLELISFEVFSVVIP